MFDFAKDKTVPIVAEEVLNDLETRARAWCKKHDATLQSSGRCYQSPYQPAIFVRVGFDNGTFFRASAPTVAAVLDDLTRLGLIVARASAR